MSIGARLDVDADNSGTVSDTVCLGLFFGLVTAASRATTSASRVSMSFTFATQLVV